MRTNMDKRNHFYIVLIIGVLKDLEVVGVGICDGTTSPDLPAGELGLLGTFPWLGLLRVHLHESKKTALSGVVLVRDKYAIGIAEDIAKIPLRIFREESDILFVPSSGQTWVCGLLDYLTHPNYDSGIITIALVELDLEGRGQVPFSAVCWTHVTGAIDLDELYTVGYSDGLEGMEYGKMILKLQYVNKTTCEAYYTSNAVSAPGFPAETLCAAAVGPESEKDCVWDMGQALISNTTGYWTLIGLSIQGPTCSEPGRFLNFLHYRKWVHSALDPTFRDQGYRRTGHGIGFQKKKKVEIQDIPISQTLDYSGRRQVGKPKLNATKAANATKVLTETDILRNMALSVYPYPFKDPESQFSLVIDRVDKDAINISVFASTYEIAESACQSFNHLIYRDRTRVVAKGKAGKAAYRLTLYDMLLNNITCIQIEAKSLSRSKAKLWWTTFLDKGEGTFKSSANTPGQMLKLIPVKPLYPKKPDPYGKFDPKDYFHLEPQSIKDQFDTMHIINVNLLVTLEFKHEVMLHLKMYGQPATEPPPTTTTTEEPSSTSEPPPVTAAPTKISELVDVSTFNFTVKNLSEPYKSQYPAPGRRSNSEENPYDGSRRIRLWSNNNDVKVREIPHNRKNIRRKNENNYRHNVVREIAHSREAGVSYSDEERVVDDTESQNKNIPQKNGNNNGFNGVRETAHSREVGVSNSDEERVTEDTVSESQNKQGEPSLVLWGALCSTTPSPAAPPSSSVKVPWTLVPHHNDVHPIIPRRGRPPMFSSVTGDAILLIL